MYCFEIFLSKLVQNFEYTFSFVKLSRKNFLRRNIFKRIEPVSVGVGSNRVGKMKGKQVDEVWSGEGPKIARFEVYLFCRFASITINLGPTFLSGALAANSESHLNKPSCPLIQGPFRHYVLNVLWIFINLLCVLLTMYHLYKLYKDLSR